MSSSPRKDYKDILYREVKENKIEICAARNHGSSHKLFRWTSWKPNSPFAPMWDVPMWQDDITSLFSEKILSDIKSIEDQLGDWKTYNIFSWTDQFVFVHKLLLLVKSSLFLYADELQVEMPDKIWIRGWMNILNPGESLPVHSHSFHENTFVSGNILLNNSDVSTEYIIPNYSTYYGNYRSKSREGSMLLFPSWVEHFVPVVNKKRYCIAFDFYTDPAIQYAKNTGNELDPMLLSVEC